MTTALDTEPVSPKAIARAIPGFDQKTIEPLIAERERVSRDAARLEQEAATAEAKLQDSQAALDAAGYDAGIDNLVSRVERDQGEARRAALRLGKARERIAQIDGQIDAAVESEKQRIYNEWKAVDDALAQEANELARRHAALIRKIDSNASKRRQLHPGWQGVSWLGNPQFLPGDSHDLRLGRAILELESRPDFYSSQIRKLD